MSRPSRRGVLGGLAAFSAVPAAAPAAPFLPSIALRHVHVEWGATIPPSADVELTAEEIAAGTQPNPDAALIAACAGYMEKEAAHNKAFCQECDAEEAGNKAEVRRLTVLQRGLAQEQEAGLGVIIETRAMTPAGKAAKAAVAMTLVQTNSAHEPLTTEAALLWSLAEDLAGKPLVPPA